MDALPAEKREQVLTFQVRHAHDQAARDRIRWKISPQPAGRRWT
jgi:hypothetical protein